MKLVRIEVTPHRVPLSRPYSIASGTTAAIELLTVRLESDSGVVGLGAASPEESVTGESFAACTAALAPGRTSPLLGRPLSSFGALVDEIERLWSVTPAAAAALDMALHDLRARAFGRPLVELLGRVHDALPTSITIGILPLEATIAEAMEHVGHGFRALKLKVGADLDGDLERLARVRERVGPEIALRIDGNEGFAPSEVPRLLAAARELGVELVEQPSPAGSDGELASRVPESDLLVADESVHDAADALRFARRGRPYSGFVVKLMKCGGVTPARRLAAIAEATSLDLMWGCMDESVIGIAAALHAALATPATRWLDLDGSFELARDPARGGFALVDGMLTTLPAPGLGVELTE